jgi:hypothetical protein
VFGSPKGASRKKGARRCKDEKKTEKFHAESIIKKHDQGYYRENLVFSSVIRFYKILTIKTIYVSSPRNVDNQHFQNKRSVP